MTIAQMTAIMLSISEAYPRFQAEKTDEAVDRKAEFWANMFDGDDPALVTAAVKAFIATDTKGFPPVVGQIKALMREISFPGEMSEYEAWDMVMKVVVNPGYHPRERKEKFDGLPAAIRRIVGSPNRIHEWGMLPSADLETVVASNFMRSYRAVAEKQRQYDALPEGVKRLAETMAGKLAMPQCCSPENEGRLLGEWKD